MTSSIPDVWTHFMVCFFGYVDVMGSVEAALNAYKNEMTETERSELAAYLCHMAELSEEECVLQAQHPDPLLNEHFPVFSPCVPVYIQFRDVFLG